MRILLVENHETFARVVAGAFLRNHEVTIHTMVMDAQHEFDVGGFDVVMVDYDLADFKGSELINTSGNRDMKFRSSGFRQERKAMICCWRQEPARFVIR